MPPPLIRPRQAQITWLKEMWETANVAAVENKYHVQMPKRYPPEDITNEDGIRFWYRETARAWITEIYKEKIEKCQTASQPTMSAGGIDIIVNVTSDASVNPYPTWGAYSISKAALDHFGRVLAVELSDFGVKVIGVDPGEMRTRMHAEALPDADPDTLAAPEDVAARITSMIAHSEAVVTGTRVEAATWSAP